MPNATRRGRSSSGELRPPCVHRLEQRLAGRGRGRAVADEADPARQVRVLHARDRGVAAVHELERLDHAGVHPAGPGGRRDDEDRPVPGVGAVELVDDARRRGVEVAVGVEARVGVDRLAHVRGVDDVARLGERGQLVERRPGHDELAALRAQRVPRLGGRRRPGPLGLGRGRQAGVDVGVRGRVDRVERAHRARPDDAVEHEHHDDRDRHAAHEPRDRGGHDPADEPRDPARDAAQPSPGLEHEQRDDERQRERGDLAPRDVLGHAEQVPQLDLAAGAEDQGERDEHDGRPGEHPPRDPARARRPPQAQPDLEREPLDERPDAVPADRAHARDHGLVVPGPGDEGGRERQAEPEQREHQPGRREPPQPPSPRSVPRGLFVDGLGGTGLRHGGLHVASVGEALHAVLSNRSAPAARSAEGGSTM